MVEDAKNKNNLNNNMEEKIKYFLSEMKKIPALISSEKDILSSDYLKGYKDAIDNIRNLFLKIFVFSDEKLTLKMIQEGEINIEFWLAREDILRIFNEYIVDKDKGELLYKDGEFFIKLKVEKEVYLKNFRVSEIKLKVPNNEKGAEMINSIIDIDSPAVVKFHDGVFWLGFKNDWAN